MPNLGWNESIRDGIAPGTAALVYHMMYDNILGQQQETAIQQRSTVCLPVTFMRRAEKTYQLQVKSDELQSRHQGEEEGEVIMAADQGISETQANFFRLFKSTQDRKETKLYQPRL